MFSPNTLYDYLRCFFYDTKKPSIIRTFDHHGSKNLFNANNSNVSNNISPYITNKHHPHIPYKFFGYCEMFDEESIDLLTIYNQSTDRNNQHLYINAPQFNKIKLRVITMIKQMNLIQSPLDFISRYSAAVHVPIICHSELNSIEVEQLENEHFISIYYWYHAYIAREWFREYKYLHTHHTLAPYRFGLYARDASGTRKYRLKLINRLCNDDMIYYNAVDPILSQAKLHNINLQKSQQHFKINSNNSALIEWNDTKNFDIQIVAETLFDTGKIHLTEKIFKPIVMEQPFILLSGANSLKYLKSYGFQTFENIWDESYDTELDHNTRFDKIINLIDYLHKLPINEYITIFKKAKQIAAYNRKYFFSTAFEDILYNELHTNITHAFEIQNELFYTLPGGTWFYMLDKSHRQGLSKTDSETKISNDILQFMSNRYPSVVKDISKRYSAIL